MVSLKGFFFIIIFALHAKLFVVYGQPNIYADCQVGTGYAELNINNVRAQINSAADMWWDYNTSKYEIPKGSGKTSIFSGSIWIGGIDDQGVLKVSSMSYRQSGVDFWPGPLDSVYASTDQSTCNIYDNVYAVTRVEVEYFLQYRNDPTYVIPQNILNWPGNGNTALGISHYLAPFNDVDGDGIYNPHVGDYPKFNFTTNQNCKGDLLGDQCLCYVFNDKGNIQTETGGDGLGFEIQTQAVAYNRCGDIKNTTFYQYKVINRSYYTINNFYWGNWADVDLGLYSDDYVGCDVMRGLGYAYNGDADDGGNAPTTYGLHPPAVGLGFPAMW